MRLEVLGAILAMIAPFLFHYLLQTHLKMRYIALIMGGIVLLCIFPIIDLTAFGKYLSSLPQIGLIRFAVFAAIIILVIWRFFYFRKRGRKLMKFDIKNRLQAVIFDMDGLMVDTERLYWEVFNEIAAGYGIKEIGATVMNKMMGRPPLDSTRVFVEELKLPVAAEVLLEQRDVLMERKLRNGVEPMPGLSEIIAAFSGRLKLAIATSSSRLFLDIVVDKLEIREKFDVIQTSEGVGRGKPDPEIFLQAIAKLGVKPEECIVLEDSVNGVLAASRAGCYVIAVPSEYSKNQDFSMANYIARDLNEASEHILLK